MLGAVRLTNAGRDYHRIARELIVDQWAGRGDVAFFEKVLGGRDGSLPGASATCFGMELRRR